MAYEHRSAAVRRNKSVMNTGGSQGIGVVGGGVKRPIKSLIMENTSSLGSLVNLVTTSCLRVVPAVEVSRVVGRCCWTVVVTGGFSVAGKLVVVAVFSGVFLASVGGIVGGFVTLGVDVVVVGTSTGMLLLSVVLVVGVLVVVMVGGCVATDSGLSVIRALLIVVATVALSIGCCKVVGMALVVVFSKGITLLSVVVTAVSEVGAAAPPDLATGPSVTSAVVTSDCGFVVLGPSSGNVNMTFCFGVVAGTGVTVNGRIVLVRTGAISRSFVSDVTVTEEVVMVVMPPSVCDITGSVLITDWLLGEKEADGATGTLADGLIYSSLVDWD